LWIFLGLRTSLELFFINQKPFCKISELNRNNELFLNRKSRVLGPWVVDHGRVARSTMDWWWHGQEVTGARQCAHRCRASGHSMAQKLAGRGGARRSRCGPHRSSSGGVAVGQRRRRNSVVIVLKLWERG
jgi:hypothetical protein